MWTLKCQFEQMCFQMSTQFSMLIYEPDQRWKTAPYSEYRNIIGNVT